MNYLHVGIISYKCFHLASDYRFSLLRLVVSFRNVSLYILAYFENLNHIISRVILRDCPTDSTMALYFFKF